MTDLVREEQIVEMYVALVRAWGAQHWWPARSRFEVIVGAYLTQNTNWTNVEIAMKRLRRAKVLNVAGIRNTPVRKLEELIRSSGYFRQKAARLKLFVQFLDNNYSGSLSKMFAEHTNKLREELLSLNGVGPETADSILLYAGQHPIFVVDAYTRRMALRHGILTEKAGYEDFRILFERALGKASPRVLQNGVAISLGGAAHRPSRMSLATRVPLAQVYNDTHGYIVGVGKKYCLKSRPRCEECPLRHLLPRGPAIAAAYNEHLQMFRLQMIERMVSPDKLPPKPGRRKLIIFLSIGSLLLFGVLLSLSSFDLPFINPATNQQTVFLAALSALVFLLFVTLTFVLARNLIKLFAERRLGVLGSKFRTRLVVGSLLLSFIPVIVMFWFAYGLMNRSIDKWFSTPVEEVRQDTALMASLLSRYAADNAQAEAASIAASAETQHAFEGHSFSGVLNEFRSRSATLQGGFAIAIESGNAEASFGAPAAWPLLKPVMPLQPPATNHPQSIRWKGSEYILGRAPVGGTGEILVAMPLPSAFLEAQKQLDESQQRYLQLARDRRTVRRTYMAFLWWITGMVLFASMWLALFLSRLVTRPVAALAEAMQEVSRGNLDYRVDVPAADELGDLVRSFNQMAVELKTSRQQLEASSHDLSAANSELEQRRRHIEIILESIPTGVLSLDAGLRVRHVNHALLRMLRPEEKAAQVAAVLIGSSLRDVFPAEVLEDLNPLLRRADRMGTTTTQMEFAVQRVQLNVAVTVATLQHKHERMGYVVVFEDLSDLLRAQRQAAWREVARRVAHEIKNPLTPIALSADRILRHLDRGEMSGSASLDVVRSCAETIGGAVETVRTLVNEFATLASFPASQPQPADINAIIVNALAMFNGRLDGIHVRTVFSNQLPKVMADPEAIKRAMANLVDNAAEALQDATLKEIEVTTALVASRDAIEISVADSGPGVTHELKERLFLPYFSTKKRGTGLGLAIVSRIIEDHHGSIRVEENRPVGARFVVELPIVADAAAPSSLTHQHA